MYKKKLTQIINIYKSVKKILYKKTKFGKFIYFIEIYIKKL